MQTNRNVAGAERVVFLARGLEKARILSNLGVHVINLEDEEHCDYTSRLATAGFIYAGKENMRVQSDYCLDAIEVDRPKYAFWHSMAVHAETNVN